MAELSERFAELMARLSKSDAELFRTLGEQNASVRKMVDELTVPATVSLGGGVDQPHANDLAPWSLLPPCDCSLPALKTRFRRVADAKAWAEERLGPAPKKTTWAVLEQAFRCGAWPDKLTVPIPNAAGQQAAQLEQRLLERIEIQEQRLIKRFDDLERLVRSLHTARQPSSNP